MRKYSILAAAAALALAVTAADARTVKWARGADALTLDPHGQNEGPTIAFNNQIYEPLILRDNANKLIPGLAVSWKLADPRISPPMTSCSRCSARWRRPRTTRAISPTPRRS
jgi:ABC-type transport system substrate-binding protein